MAATGGPREASRRPQLRAGRDLPDDDEAGRRPDHRQPGHPVRGRPLRP